MDPPSTENQGIQPDPLYACGLVVILAGALFYGTVTFQKKLVSNFFVPLSTNYLSYLSSIH
jgi:hypothetical protein